MMRRKKSDELSAFKAAQITVKSVMKASRVLLLCMLFFGAQTLAIEHALDPYCDEHLCAQCQHSTNEFAVSAVPLSVGEFPAPLLGLPFFTLWDSVQGWSNNPARAPPAIL